MVVEKDRLINSINDSIFSFSNTLWIFIGKIFESWVFLLCKLLMLDETSFSVIDLMRNVLGSEIFKGIFFYGCDFFCFWWKVLNKDISNTFWLIYIPSLKFETFLINDFLKCFIYLLCYVFHLHLANFYINLIYLFCWSICPSN